MPVFFKGSRYEKVPTLTRTTTDGRVLEYKATRYIPPTPATKGHQVVDGERLDHVAWQHYRDPLRYWRICDANRALWPDDLLVPGAVLRVPEAEN